MESLYSNDVTEEINICKTKNSDFYVLKLELLQIYKMLYILYLESKSDDILNKLLKLSNLLIKCKKIEEKLENIHDVQSHDKRPIKDLIKRKNKKNKNLNSRMKFKNKNDKFKEKTKKHFDGNIIN